jgi:hypothetical protein
MMETKIYQKGSNTGSMHVIIKKEKKEKKIEENHGTPCEEPN